VEPLLAALRDGEHGVPRAAAAALAKIGWQPGNDENGAWYWVAMHEWDKCVAVGAAAVEALCAALKDTDLKVRERATESLVKIGAPSVAPLCAALEEPYRDVRGVAVEALVRIGVPAVAPLCVALEDRNEHVRTGAAEALVKIGAVEPLCAALKHPSRDVCVTAAETLRKIGWQPGMDQTAACFWMASGEWDKCVAVGAPAIAPLCAALKDANETVRSNAANALGKIGWQPGNDQNWAWYWMEMHEWDKCIALGAAAVEPLCAGLKHSEKEVRQSVAVGLLRLYRSGNLSDGDKRVILAQRETITETHTDGQVIVSGHSDNAAQYSDCTHGDNAVREHRDTGIGVDFPI